MMIASPPPLGTGDVCELRLLGISTTPFRNPTFINRYVNSIVDTNPKVRAISDKVDSDDNGDYSSAYIF